VQASEGLAHTAITEAMRRLPGYLIAFVLAMLLASTTPVGTGAGVHQLDLLHPLFSHVHLVNGRILTHEQLMERPAATDEGYTVGPSLGSSSDSASIEAGVAPSPIVPDGLLRLITSTPVGFVVDDVRTPAGNVEAPPEPPPL
jgi:hypothetical protein